jgi:hypothetical protein
VQVISNARFDFVSAFIQRRLPWLEGNLFVGIYRDLTPNWYRNVGEKLSLTLWIQIAVIFFKTAATFAYSQFTRATADRSKTQPDMNKCASCCSQHPWPGVQQCLCVPDRQVQDSMELHSHAAQHASHADYCAGQVMQLRLCCSSVSMTCLQGHEWHRL